MNRRDLLKMTVASPIAAALKPTMVLQPVRMDVTGAIKPLPYLPYNRSPEQLTQRLLRQCQQVLDDEDSKAYSQFLRENGALLE